MTTLWKMPSCSSGRASDSVRQLLGRDVEVSIWDGDEASGVASERLVFHGVESFRFTHHHSCTLDMSDAYDRLIEIVPSQWVSEIQQQLQSAGDPTAGLRHLRIYLDEGPCYEFVCRSFTAHIAEPSAAPNGGPSMPSRNSGVMEGPPSVS